MFTGQWYDQQIKQYYLRARQYDPTMMRFLTRDPVRGKYKEPITFHRYLYCLNGPINATDPSGEFLDLLASVNYMSSIRAGEAARAKEVLGIATAVVAAMQLRTVLLDLNISMTYQAWGGKEFPVGDKFNIENLNTELDKRMSGEEPPEGWWKKILYYTAKIIHNYNG